MRLSYQVFKFSPPIVRARGWRERAETSGASEGAERVASSAGETPNLL